MTTKFIELGWNSYRSMVIPDDAPDIQVKESRQAFFAGATILFEGLMGALDSGEEPTEADMQRMAAIQDKIDEFGQELDVKYLKTAEH